MNENKKKMRKKVSHKIDEDLSSERAHTFTHLTPHKLILVLSISSGSIYIFFITEIFFGEKMSTISMHIITNVFALLLRYFFLYENHQDKDDDDARFAFVVL